MTDRIWEWIEQEKMIEAGDLVIAGVSGGADSVCLLLCLLEYQKKIDFSVRVVHVEHGIRGEESFRDARFVRELCEKKRVSCQVYHVDVPGCARETGMGLEETARALRYDCYGKEAVRCALHKRQGKGRIRIALAHHANDNAETMLFRMIRGSGIRGLGGMRAKRPFWEDRYRPDNRGREAEILSDVMIIRPLLRCLRSDIEAEIAARGQAYCQDSTNYKTDCSRNYLRHCVMPELEKMNGRAAFHMAQSAEILRETAAYLEGQVEELTPLVCTDTQGGVLIREVELKKCVPLLQRELVHRALERAAGCGSDIGSVHVCAVMELFALQTGRSRNLPYRICAKRVYEGVCLVRQSADVRGEGNAYEVTPELLFLAEQGKRAVISLPDGEIRFRVFPFLGKIDEIPKKKYTKWLSYDKMKGGLQIRNRKAGDFLLIDEDGHKKKLKKYFVEEKIPGDKRDGIWLIADGPHIAWVVGGRISSDCKIEEHTGKILEIQITGGSYNEDQKD